MTSPTAKRAIERNAIKAYTKKVADRPDVQDWVERFQKLVDEMPPDIWVFVGGPTVMALDVLGKPFIGTSGGMEPAASIATIGGPRKARWAGGDW